MPSCSLSTREKDKIIDGFQCLKAEWFYSANGPALRTNTQHRHTFILSCMACVFYLFRMKNEHEARLISIFILPLKLWYLSTCLPYQWIQTERQTIATRLIIRGTSFCVSHFFIFIRKIWLFSKSLLVSLHTKTVEPCV